MWTTETVDLNGPDRRRAGRFVQSGRTSFFPVPVLRTSTTGRTVTFSLVRRHNRRDREDHDHRVGQGGFSAS